MSSMTTNRKCPACGADIVPGPAACGQCGASLRGAFSTASSFPDRLPKWLGLTIGALVTAFFITQTLAEALWGRPSSTAALGFFVAPFAGAISGGAAWLIGLIIRNVLRSRGVASMPTPSWVTRTLWMVVLIGSAAFLMIGRSSVLALEAERRPRVILDSGRIGAVNPPTIELQERANAPELQSGITNTLDAHPIDWNGTAIKLENLDEQVVISDVTGKRIASADLHAFDYINGLHAAAVCAQPDGRQLLAVLVSLRATSHRAMLLLFAPDGSLVYQHHLERRGGAKDALYTGRVNGVDAFAVDLGLFSTWTCAR